MPFFDNLEVDLLRGYQFWKYAASVVKFLDKNYRAKGIETRLNFDIFVRATRMLKELYIRLKLPIT